MRYIFHPEALTEYAEAVRYYADRRIDLGQGFVDAIEEAIFRIREVPTLLFTASLKALSGKGFPKRLFVNNLVLMTISNGRIGFVRSVYQCFC